MATSNICRSLVYRTQRIKRINSTITNTFFTLREDFTNAYNRAINATAKARELARSPPKVEAEDVGVAVTTPGTGGLVAAVGEVGVGDVVVGILVGARVGGFVGLVFGLAVTEGAEGDAVNGDKVDGAPVGGAEGAEGAVRNEIIHSPKIHMDKNSPCGW